MKKLFVVMFALVGTLAGCAAKDYPILHPTGKGWECGYNAYQYQVVVSPDTHSGYDYVLHQDERYYKIKKVCCPEGSSPAYNARFYAGYCH